MPSFWRVYETPALPDGIADQGDAGSLSMAPPGEFSGRHILFRPENAPRFALYHLEPYHDYCGHCDVLYRRVLEPLGYVYHIDLERCGRAECTITVKARDPEGIAGKMLRERWSSPKGPEPRESEPSTAGEVRLGGQISRGLPWRSAGDLPE